MTYNPNEILDLLDKHIRSWRGNLALDAPHLRQRGIDAVDALQQFRLQVFGQLLPQDDGSFKVFTEGGAYSHTVETHDEAVAIYKQP